MGGSVVDTNPKDCEHSSVRLPGGVGGFLHYDLLHLLTGTLGEDMLCTLIVFLKTACVDVVYPHHRHVSFVKGADSV